MQCFHHRRLRCRCHVACPITFLRRRLLPGRLHLACRSPCAPACRPLLGRVYVAACGLRLRHGMSAVGHRQETTIIAAGRSANAGQPVTRRCGAALPIAPLAEAQRCSCFQLSQVSIGTRLKGGVHAPRDARPLSTDNIILPVSGIHKRLSFITSVQDSESRDNSVKAVSVYEDLYETRGGQYIR